MMLCCLFCFVTSQWERHFFLFFWRRQPREEDVTQVLDAPEEETQRSSSCQQLSGQSLFPAAADPSSPCWRKCISPSRSRKQDACVQPTALKKEKEKPRWTEWLNSKWSAKTSFLSLSLPRWESSGSPAGVTQSGSHSTGNAVNGCFL